MHSARVVLFHVNRNMNRTGITSLTVVFRNCFAKPTKKKKKETLFKSHRRFTKRDRKSNCLRPAAFGIQTNQKLYRFNIELLYPILEKGKYFSHGNWSYVISSAPALLILTQPQSDHYHEPWSPLESISSP